MSAAEKLLLRMQRTRVGWGQNDFDRLYRGFGFEVVEGANHRLYKHPSFPQLRATVGRHDQLARGYADSAVKLIATLQEIELEAKPETDAKS